MKKVKILILLTIILSFIVVINKVNAENIELKIETKYIYDKKTNTVIGKIISNIPLKDTKASWKLSEDGLTYTNEKFKENGSYYTWVEDIYGNKAEVLIDINLIDDKAPEIKMEYKYNAETNTVTAIMHSNEELKDTKTSWSLNSDKTIYTSSEMTSNGAYYTWVEDRYGNKTKVLIEITQIDDKPPIINLEYEYNVADNTVIVTMNSNEILGDTKPTWKLSEDNLKYKKVFSEDQEYATPVEDRYGNQTWIKIKIKTKSFTYTNNKGPNVTVKYLYDSNENVTVYIISDQKLKDTKPTWKLSKDKMVYTKIFTNNDNYTTPIEDIEVGELEELLKTNFLTEI